MSIFMTRSERSSVRSFSRAGSWGSIPPLRPAVSLLPVNDATAACEHLIEGPVDSTTGAAVEALGALLPSNRTAIEALLPRLDPRKHHPYPAWATARYLLERGFERTRALELIEAFAAVEKVEGYVGNPFDDQLAVLLLEHAPERAIPLARRALRSKTPRSVLAMSALLASVDRPWCHRELSSALVERANDLPQARYLVAALARSTSQLARRLAGEFSLSVPVREPGQVGFTYDEVVAANIDEEFEREIERQRPIAQRLRRRLPEDFGLATS